MLSDIIMFIIKTISSVIQVIVWPINQIIIGLLPDLSEKLVYISDNVGNLFSSVSWALGIIPTPILSTLLFILTIEIAKHTIYISTHVITIVFSLIRRIKFW